MQLSKLEVFGFKSFAQKATFKFDAGLTGVIGPNGCGKSNIVDAIRWVLGEQRPSVLRAERMDNLIFGGTATRKPLSMAEVSVYIENNKKILPSEYSEIKITRRLHRSGDSEYLMNNENVRLMDIVNLFADTGMGADAYSVIELKMVEQILSDNAQERRRLFEEAAGIKKFKARRRSALLKLDTTEQELTRLDDILSEVQKAVNSLSRQVGKARRYHEYKTEITEKDLLLTHLRINSYQTELVPLRAELDEVGKTRDSLGNDVLARESQLEKQQAESVDLEQNYRDAAAEVHRRDEGIQELQSRRKLREQRIESLQETTTTYIKEIASQKAKIDQHQAESAELHGELSRNQTEGQNAQEAYRHAANAQLEAENEYQTLREKYQKFVHANMAQLQEGSSVKESFQKTQVELDTISEHVERQQQAVERYTTEVSGKESNLLEAEKKLKDLLEEQETYQQELEHIESEMVRLREQKDTLRQVQTADEGKLEKHRSRRDFLRNLIDNYEGFSQSVQYVMSQKTKYSGIVDTLANLVECGEQYRPALESYLKGVSNYLVVDKIGTATDILDHIRNKDKGRMTLVPLSLLNGKLVSEKDLPAANGKMQPLNDVVTYPEKYNKLFSFLLREVYLVDSLDTAITLRRDYPNLTYVTESGDILEHWGNVTGGAKATTTGLIGRKEQLQKLEAKFEALSAEISKREAELASVDQTLAENESKLEEFVDLLKTAREDVRKAEVETAQIKYDVARLQETLNEVRGELGAYQERTAQLQSQITGLQPELADLEARSDEYKVRETEMLAAQEAAQANFKSITESTQEKQINFLNLNSREKELGQRLQFVERSITEAGQFVVDREKRIQQNKSEIEQLEQENKNIATELDIAFKERDVVDKNKDEIEKQFQESKSAIQLSEVELKKQQRLWNQARERIRELELHIREIEVKLQTVTEQGEERYGAEALKFDIKELDPSIAIADVQTRLEELKRKLENLGDVNPLAIKEHEREKERLDFLNTQRNDLLEAREQLLETIDKLNKTARKQFMETFEKIQINFQHVFGEFFEGGEARLRLVEKNDPLEASIEFSLFHKGKQLDALSLLSAGEKTLTAISLLFAIYLVKPSPFCILDEVDAPLDDVNISRLSKALDQFSQDTQFILVTHNKKTMEATGSLYGVTMEEQGVSKVVSVRFD